MNMTLLPYMKSDGIPTLKDSEIMAETIFFDGQLNSREEWLDSITTGRNALYVALLKTLEPGPFGRSKVEPAAICWLNNANGKAIEMHWCVFSKFWSNGSADIMRFAADKLINMKSDDEEYVFDVLIGLVPVTNQRAISLSRKAGGIAEYVVPNALYDYRSSKSVDAMLVHYTRSKWEEDWSHGKLEEGYGGETTG